MREMAKERGISLAELGNLAEKDPSIDKEMDDWQTKIGQNEDNIILDGKIAFYFVPDSIKIFLSCDERIAAERTSKDTSSIRDMEDKAKDIEEEIKNNKIRLECEKERYKKYYNLNHHDKKHFDVIIDTSHMTPEQVVEKIIEFLKIKKYL
jgi:cytidylate kinase